MRTWPIVLVALLALGGCAEANLQITSPLADVRVRTPGQSCVTPCTLRVPVGRTLMVKAYDPAGLTDFTYQITPQDGLNELEVLAPRR
jgi:hypothetical protein